MKEERKWLTVALENGAKIVKMNNFHGLIVVLDQKHNWLFHAFFADPETAARAYCDHYRLPWPQHSVSPKIARRAFELTGDPIYKWAVQKEPEARPQFFFWGVQDHAA